MARSTDFSTLFLIILLCVGPRLHGQTPASSLLIDSTRVLSTSVPPLLPADPLPSPDLLHMPSPYSYQCLGVFCKAEVQMNKWFPIPVMIRMGDVEQAEELDGKGAYHGAPH